MTARTATRAASALALLAFATGLVGLGYAGPAAQAAPAETAARAATASSGAGAGTSTRTGGWHQTRTLTRVFTNPDGSTYQLPSYTVTVTADQTRDLRGRQRILLSWSGAQPSAARASNPYGENGLLQEYPVVVLQCRGLDDPSLPAAEQLSPSTCWTGSVAERSQITRSGGEAAWTHDLAAVPADKERVSGLAPFPGPDVCPTADIDPYFTRLTAFVTAKGQVFPACDADHMPPEAAVGAAFPAAELAAFTSADGTGSVEFEVRSEVENGSLGCSHEVACSIVVIPIIGPSCDLPSNPPATAAAACRKGGRFPPGSSNFAADGVDQAVSPALWWSASNWANRFSIPITMGLPPDTCDILDPRPPTGFYGSELLGQAALQWSPAYCLKRSRFKFQLNEMPDDTGFSLMESGGGPAAEVSSEHPTTGSDPIGYAPTAVTGFGIGYVIDKPDNAGEFTHLRLDARLLAKLLTQSYLGSDLGRDHPGMGDNPLSLLSDPEFIRLNPGLSHNDQEAAATVLSLSNSSDVMEQLTDYISHDKAAMAFVDGTPDPWGMVVNPAYRGIDLPTAECPLLDTYVPTTENACRTKNPGVYFSQIAAPVTTMAKIAEALLDAWPNVQTRCDKDQSTGLYKLGRIDRQSFGSRFMLGVVTLADAARYGLRSAALETARGRYVEPTDASLAKAVRLMHREKRYAPYVLDQRVVRHSGGAYPGTMAVYTAARLAHLDAGDAAKVAQFVRISTTEGQRRGSGNGQLPDGYLPITRHGVTGNLYRSAQAVAAAIAAQKADPGPRTPTSSPTADATPPATVPDASAPGPHPAADEPGDGSPSASPSTPAAPAADPPALPAASTPATSLPATQLASSGLAHGILPAVAGLGVLALLVATGLRFFVRVPRGDA